MLDPVTLAWTCGVPGSGKSTFCRRLAELGWVHISRDEIRKQFGEYTHLKEMCVVQQMEAMVKGHLLNRRNVVIDNVNNEIWQRTRYGSWGKDLWDICKLKHRKVCLYFPCELEVALERRQEKIAAEPDLERFIRAQSEQFVEPMPQEGFHVYIIDAHKTEPLLITKGPMARPFERKDLR